MSIYPSPCLYGCLPSCRHVCSNVYVTATLSVCLNVALPAWMSTLLSSCLFQCLPTCRLVCSDVHLSAILSVWMSTYLSPCLFAGDTVCMAFYLPAFSPPPPFFFKAASVYLPICLSTDLLHSLSALVSCVLPFLPVCFGENFYAILMTCHQQPHDSLPDYLLACLLLYPPATVTTCLSP